MNTFVAQEENMSFILTKNVKQEIINLSSKLKLKKNRRKK